MATGDHQDCDYCPFFQHALELIGRRWTGSILKVISDRSLRFGEIRSEIPGLSDRLLDARLTELEDEGIVVRDKATGEVRYSLTEKGVGLGPVFGALTGWAKGFAEEPNEPAVPGRRRTSTT